MLETDRLVLRRFCAADLDELVALDSDPEVMFFITGGRATPREQVEREVLPAFIAGGYWAAVEKVGGRFIGWFLRNEIFAESFYFFIPDAFHR